jgi:riboflavin synthase
MFTGIISDLGRVRAVEWQTGGRVAIETALDTESLAIGASLACSGACLTVVDRGPGWFAVDVSQETRSCTTLGGWQAGTPVNLERALALGDELGGHIVLGHVDGVARVADRQPDGESLRFTIETPTEFARYIAPKGSVALDGVSLTVNEVSGDRFGVNVIPHTQRVTTFGALEPGAPVNLEVDLLARYVARLMAGTA